MKTFLKKQSIHLINAVLGLIALTTLISAKIALDKNLIHGIASWVFYLCYLYLAGAIILAVGNDIRKSFVNAITATKKYKALKEGK